MVCYLLTSTNCDLLLTYSDLLLTYINKSLSLQSKRLSTTICMPGWSPPSENAAAHLCTGHILYHNGPLRAKVHSISATMHDSHRLKGQLMLCMSAQTIYVWDTFRITTAHLRAKVHSTYSSQLLHSIWATMHGTHPLKVKNNTQHFSTSHHFNSTQRCWLYLTGRLEQSISAHPIKHCQAKNTKCPMWHGQPDSDPPSHFTGQVTLALCAGPAGSACPVHWI